jgi:hypothetical protein
MCHQQSRYGALLHFLFHRPRQFHLGRQLIE